MSLAFVWQEMRAQAEADKAAAIRQLLAQCDALAALGAAKIVIEYEGSGDDGETSSALAYDAENHEVLLSDELADELSELADKLIPDGYENNDGGQGSIEFDLATRQITHEHSDFYIESETTHSVYDQAFLDENSTEPPAPSS